MKKIQVHFQPHIIQKDTRKYLNICLYLARGKIRNDITLIADKKNKWAGYTNWGKLTMYNKNGKSNAVKEKINAVPLYSLRTNIWKYTTSLDAGTNNHPAVFPEKLANDHILSWSLQNEIVYDPFIGSGTTAKMAIANRRHYIGSEISFEYYQTAVQRTKNVNINLF